MSEQITLDKSELDEAIFAACQEIADTLPALTTRQKVQFALDASTHIMKSVEAMTEAGKRSESAKKAAAARYSKAKPTPGPAIPPEPTNAQLTQAALTAPPLPSGLVVPPPPHPSLSPSGATPFGAPPQ
jgi:hypothetical protein